MFKWLERFFSSRRKHEKDIGTDAEDYIWVDETTDEQRAQDKEVYTLSHFL